MRQCKRNPSLFLPHRSAVHTALWILFCRPFAVDLWPLLSVQVWPILSGLFHHLRSEIAFMPCCIIGENIVSKSIRPSGHGFDRCRKAMYDLASFGFEKVSIDPPGQEVFQHRGELRWLMLVQIKMICNEGFERVSSFLRAPPSFRCLTKKTFAVWFKRGPLISASV